MSSKPAGERRPGRVGSTLRALVRTRITTGLIVVLPIMVTIWVVRIVFSWLRDASLGLVLWALGSRWCQQVWNLEGPTGGLVSVDAFINEHPALSWGIDISSVLLTFFLLYLIGLFAANIFGRRALGLLDAVMERVPLAKTIYRATKQILSSFAGDQTQSFQRVAIIPFPQDRMRCVGFITNVFRDSLTGEELCTVFIPTTPNPTTGYLQILRRADITEMNWSVEQAIRTIMSGGILRPDFLTIVPNKQLPSDAPNGVGPSELLTPTTPTAPPSAPPEPPGR